MLHDPDSSAIQVRVSGQLFRRLENWRRAQPKIPARSEALRALIEQALPQSDAASADDEGARRHA
jgi:hypothetical protein